MTEHTSCCTLSYMEKKRKKSTVTAHADSTPAPRFVTQVVEIIDLENGQNTEVPVEKVPETPRHTMREDQEEVAATSFADEEIEETQETQETQETEEPQMEQHPPVSHEHKEKPLPPENVEEKKRRKTTPSC